MIPVINHPIPQGIDFREWMLSMPVVTLDLETYWDDQYSLSKMTMLEYVQDPRFKIQGIGIRIDYPHLDRYGEQKYYRDVNEAVAVLKSLDKWVMVGQNTKFDGYCLHYHHDVHATVYADTRSMSKGLWPFESASLKNLAIRLWPDNEIMRKGDELASSKGVRDWPESLHQTVGDIYCNQDVYLTAEAFWKMLPDYPTEELEIIHITTRMVCIPTVRTDHQLLQEAIDDEKRERAIMLERTLEAINQAIKDKGLDYWNPDEKEAKKRKPLDKMVLSSRNRYIKLLREIFDLEIPMKEKTRPDGSTYMTEALAKNDPECIQLQEENPDLAWLFEARDMFASSQSLSRAQRMIDISKPEKGNEIPIPLNYYEAHCVTGDVEVLTPQGWESIKDWQGGEIAQVNSDREIKFLSATKFEGPEVQDWVRVDAAYLSADFTLGHTIPYLNHGSMKWNQMQAADMLKRNSLYIPVSGFYNGPGVLTVEQIRCLVMIQADGSFCTDSKQGRQLTIFLKKERKINRARKLLSEAGVNFRELTFPSWPGYVKFVVSYKDYPYWLTPDKKYFGSWLLDQSLDVLTAFVEELHRWDGSLNGDTQQCYFSSIKSNAEWAATIGHLTGKSATIREVFSTSAYGKAKVCYSVTFRERGHIMVKSADLSLRSLNERAYCTQTQTGFWLARKDGRIFVTGNTGRYTGGEKINMQNLGRGSKHRLALLAPEGFVMHVADSSNVEARTNAGFAGQEELLEAFRNKRDVYSEFASKAFDMPVNKKDNPTERGAGKVCVLGLGYGMGAPTLKRTFASGPMGMEPTNFPLDMCQQMVHIYRSDNYMIAQSWRTASKYLEIMCCMQDGDQYEWGPLVVMKDKIRLPNGMHLNYPKLHFNTHYDSFVYWNGKFWKRIYGGALIENIIQALARIIVMHQCIKIDRLLQQYGGWIVMQVHDENIGIAKDLGEEKNDQLFKEINQLMCVPPTWMPELPLDSEGGWAVNYSK
ncbi:MAG: DNA polymerase [Alishewanella aestuarii]